MVPQAMSVTLGEPLHNNITGDSAYVVVPASMTFKVQGKQVTQTGALLYGCPSQACRGLANRGLGVVEGHSIRTSTTIRNCPCSSLTTFNTSC